MSLPVAGVTPCCQLLLLPSPGCRMHGLQMMHQHAVSHTSSTWTSGPIATITKSTHHTTTRTQVDDSGLVLDHEGQAVLDALAADARVTEALEGEVLQGTKHHVGQ
jgi:hypothetical protein